MIRKHSFEQKYMSKSNVFNMPLLFACMAFIIFAYFFVGWTGAWFTATDSDTINPATPSVSLQVKYGNDVMTNSTAISLDSASDITIHNTSNIAVFVRAKVIVNCVDSSGVVLTDLDPTDYANYTINANFTAVTGYNTNFLYYYDSLLIDNTDPSYDNTYPYDMGFKPLAKSGANSGTSVTIVSGINNTSCESLPTGVSIKISVFAEAIQVDTSKLGLHKWLA